MRNLVSYNFATFKTCKLVKREFSRQGHELLVYQDTERNPGFERFDGQIIDASGNIVATVLCMNSEFETLKRLRHVYNALTDFLK